MKKILLATTAILFAIFINSALFAQSTITQWNFEDDTINPNVGTGTLTLIGGTTATFATGFNGGRGWNTTTYPAQGTAPKTAGIQINVSTANYSNILLHWDHRHSNTSANKVVLQYTLDASVTNPVWIDIDTFLANAGDAWFQRNHNFSSITGMNNNPNAAFRIVSDFSDGSNYVASNPSSTYAGGTWRFDNITISGTPAGPSLSVTPTSLSGFNYTEGFGPSASQSYTISGSNLSGSGDITVTAPVSYEVSLNDFNFSTSLSLPFSGGAINNQPVTIYVRLKANLSEGDYNGEHVTHSGGGAASVSLTCNGIVYPFTPAMVKMNEIFSRGTTSDPDWIEIFNITSSAVDLTGYKIYDIGGQSGTKPKKEFPAGTIIPQAGFYVIVVDDTTESGFGLSSSGEEVWFESPTGQIIDNVTFPALEVTQSYARIPDGSGSWQIANTITRGTTNNLSGIFDDQITKDFKLYQNYPNPFNPSTTIEFNLEKQSHVTLKIYNVLGNEIKTLLNGIQPVGNYRIPFSAGSIGNGSEITSGVYFYKLTVDGVSITKKMNLIK